MLPDAVALFFDDYDFDTRHPESFRKWLEDGADYNAWKTPALRKVAWATSRNGKLVDKLLTLSRCNRR